MNAVQHLQIIVPGILQKLIGRQEADLRFFVVRECSARLLRVLQLVLVQQYLHVLLSQLRIGALLNRIDHFHGVLWRLVLQSEIQIAEPKVIAESKKLVWKLVSELRQLKWPNRWDEFTK